MPRRRILDRIAFLAAAASLAALPSPAHATFQTIPEPSTISLLAAGVAGAAVAIRLWRRK